MRKRNGENTDQRLPRVDHLACHSLCIYIVFLFIAASFSLRFLHPLCPASPFQTFSLLLSCYRLFVYLCIYPLQTFSFLLSCCPPLSLPVYPIQAFSLLSCYLSLCLLIYSLPAISFSHSSEAIRKILL